MGLRHTGGAALAAGVDQADSSVMQHSSASSIGPP
jgi:hypothetical protein